jgi:chromosome partitioning protein
MKKAAALVARIITVAQQKGGAGKTTLAAHLAVAYSGLRNKVALIDTDPQGSLAQWHSVRAQVFGEGKTGFTFSSVSGWRVRGEIERLKHGHDIVIIDSPPHTETEARSAIRAADIVVVPLQPSPMDVWATTETINICKQEKKPVKMVLNRVNPNARLTEVIAGEMVGLAENWFGNRVVYAGSLMEGKGVTEVAPNSMAAAEVLGLAKEIRDYLNKKAKADTKVA